MELPNFKAISQDQVNHQIIALKADAVVKLCSAFNGASQLLAYALAEFQHQYQGSVEFYQIDIDADPGLTDQYHIDLLPTLLFFKKGELVDKISGLTSRTMISSRIHGLIINH
jgi:thioredoxin 1